MCRRLLIGIICVTSIFHAAVAQDLSIIPLVNVVEKKPGVFNINSATVIIDATQHGAMVQFAILQLNEEIKALVNYTLPLSSKKANRTSIAFSYSKALSNKEGYQIQINQHQLVVQASTETGIFYAVQTLRQMLHQYKGKNGFQLPCADIQDNPMLPYRGLMLDVSRHFMPIEFLKKCIDMMSTVKLNTLHLHLTDDQGWRIEIKKYPLLTSVGSKRNGTIVGKYPGKGSDNTPVEGFYTQAALKELVRYAQLRQITIVPEIEMPGHSSAAIAAYPMLSCFPQQSTDTIANMYAQKTLNQLHQSTKKIVQETWGVFNDVYAPTEYTFHFLQDVLNEVMAIFPSPLIHIGGDECPKENWNNDPFCKQLMAKLQLKDAHALQSYFIQRIEKYLNTKGRNLIGWDEILEGGLAPNATVMSWRGEAGGIEAAQKNHPVIMTPLDFCYFNFYQSTSPKDSIAWGGLLPLEKVYKYNPIPAELSNEQKKYIIGLQANLWTEYIKSPSLAEYMLFPRTFALAEVAWTKNKPSYFDFTGRLNRLYACIEPYQLNYSHHLYQININSSFKNEKIDVTVNGVPPGIPVYYTLKEDAVPQVYQQSIKIDKDASVHVFVKNGMEIQDEAAADFTLNKVTGAAITLAEMPSPPYHQKGAVACVDGTLGNNLRFNDGNWLGWNGKDFSASITLSKPQNIQQVQLRFFNSKGSWVYLPKEVTIEVSVDGIHYNKVVVSNDFPSAKDGSNTYSYTINTKDAVQYMRIGAKNYGIIPQGQNGAGNPAWLFVDEIVVR